MDDVNDQNDSDSYNYRNLQSSVIAALVKDGQFERASAWMARWNQRGWVNAAFAVSLYDNAATPAQQLARLDRMEATLTRYPVLD